MARIKTCVICATSADSPHVKSADPGQSLHAEFRIRCNHGSPAGQQQQSPFRFISASSSSPFHDHTRTTAHTRSTSTLAGRGLMSHGPTCQPPWDLDFRILACVLRSGSSHRQAHRTFIHITNKLPLHQRCVALLRNSQRTRRSDAAAIFVGSYVRAIPHIIPAAGCGAALVPSRLNFNVGGALLTVPHLLAKTRPFTQVLLLLSVSRGGYTTLTPNESDVRSDVRKWHLTTRAPHPWRGPTPEGKLTSKLMDSEKRNKFIFGG